MSSKKPRVLILYGTETGTARNGIEDLSKKWKAEGITIDKCVPANEAQKNFTSLAEEYDVLLVATSSYGEGDPPWNYTPFLLELTKAANAGQKPLEGLQHAVLGYGASVYATFQNTPRLTDKLLGECGSRRLAQRQEHDETEDKDNETKLDTFYKDVLAACKALPKPDAPPVCDWTTPASRILEKTEEELTDDAPKGDLMGALLTFGLVGAVAAVYYAYSSGAVPSSS
jgi:sulfite reductase alpha subunit-like flavoprotein